MNGTKNIITVSKNAKGETHSYKIIINVKMRAIFENDNFIEKTFIKSVTYNAVKRISISFHSIFSTFDIFVSFFLLIIFHSNK